MSRIHSEAHVGGISGCLYVIICLISQGVSKEQSPPAAQISLAASNINIPNIPSRLIENAFLS